MDKFLKKKRDEVVESLKKRKKVRRKHDSDNINYEFIAAGTDSEPRAQCVE